jgi:WD40 repeat protein
MAYGVMTVAWSKAGPIASGSADYTVKIWDPKYSSQVNGVSFSADGSLVASCSGD